jgi:hypothetical protein
MSLSNTDGEAFRRAVKQIGSCALDEQGIHEQRLRYLRLAPGVADIERADESVQIRFAPGFDRPALDELVAVEEQCCPFFEFAFNEQKRQLTVTVSEAEQIPALDVIAAQLTRAAQLG